jgi:putative signal transducing protein
MSRLIAIATGVDPFQATLIKSQLEAYNIPVLLSHESAGVAYGVTVGSLGLVDILVAEEHRQEAQAILDDSNTPNSKSADQPEA